MSTKIDWCDETLNPFVGCSEGCPWCYAAKLHNRRHEAWKGGRWPSAPKQYHFPFNVVQFHADRLKTPMKWLKPKRIFLNSMTDIFDPKVNRADMDRTMAMVALCRQHTFLILTKQARAMREYLANPGVAERVACEMCFLMSGIRPPTVPQHLRAPWPLPNLQVGVSVTNQDDADERIPELLQSPAFLRFVSVEPLVGPVDLSKWLDCTGMPDCNVCDGQRLHWVICGGMTGKDAVAMYPAWVRSLRDQCVSAGVPFFFKGWGEWCPGENYSGRAPFRNWKEFRQGETVPHPVSIFGDEASKGHQMVVRIGKKKAGWLLDGREWREYPA